MSKVLRPVWRSLLNPVHGTTVEPPVPLVELENTEPNPAGSDPLIRWVSGRPRLERQDAADADAPHVVRLEVEAADEAMTPVVVRTPP